MFFERAQSYAKQSLGCMALGLGLFTIVATSVAPKTVSGVYFAQSDCPESLEKGYIEVRESIAPATTSPPTQAAGPNGEPAVDPTEVGFPSGIFQRKKDSSGSTTLENTGEGRRCLSGPAVSSGSDSAILFMCRDPDDELVCTIALSAVSGPASASPPQ